MRTISKDNVYNVETCQERKSYLAPCTEVIDVECCVSILAGSGDSKGEPKPSVDNNDWADPEKGME